MERPFLAENTMERESIRALVASLTDEDLSLTLGEGWTVALTLAHLTFWDHRVLVHFAKVEARRGQFFTHRHGRHQRRYAAPYRPLPRAIARAAPLARCGRPGCVSWPGRGRWSCGAMLSGGGT